MTKWQGWYNMGCWNCLSTEQQNKLIEWGNLPIDYRQHVNGPCRNGAVVGIETAFDSSPGPRFYCLDCSIKFLQELRKKADPKGGVINED